MTNRKSSTRNIALCYIRQSLTRDVNDTNSPERQRENIQLECDRRGWIPEWYEDAEGHKSGRQIKNRPGWLTLSKRIGDADVVAVVANDLARLHRKGWRIGDLIDQLSQHDVALVLTAPGRQFDTSGMQGRMLAQMTAMFDEYYAEDISQRAKDSIAHRKRQGKTIGMPPFGTIRDKDGFLIPSSDGAWLLVDTGQFVTGTENKPPTENAIWKGYYLAAERILTLYATAAMGIEKLAYQMNDEGWAFRDRKGTPRPFTGDDIRRIVASWAVYGGLTTHRKSKDYPAYEQTEVDKIPFNSNRAVFPIELLKEVARVRQQRSIKPLDRGKKRRTRFYPLTKITRCAHCDTLAEQHANPKLQSALNGVTMNGVRRYRHQSGATCGCQAKSMPADILEEDFKRLIDLFYIDPEMLEMMTTLVSRFTPTRLKDGTDPEKVKQENIALCHRRIQATIQVYREGRINLETYKRDIEKDEQELAYWETYATEKEQIGVELAMCLEVVDKISRLWELSDDEDRQGMARNLFAYLVVDLDKGQIVDFHLKPWAERFLRVRASFFDGDGKQKTSLSDSQHDMPHTGLEPRLRFIQFASKTVLYHVFSSQSPLMVYQKAISVRNQAIMQRRAEGELVTDLGDEYGLSFQRISQIAQGRRW